MNKKRLIIIDDHEPTLKTLAKIFIEEGWEVETFADPVNAMEFYRYTKDKFAVVLTDMSLNTSIDGIDIIVQIKDLDEKIPIIIITANQTKTCKEACESLQVKDFFTKPLNYESLIESVNSCVA